MKFDFCIGNPPYQEDRKGESKTALPVYHDFMDAAYEVADIVELITPARFLFNAGDLRGPDTSTRGPCWTDLRPAGCPARGTAG